jgi:hypothetical protein
VAEVEIPATHDLLPILREIAAEDGYAPSRRDLDEWVEIATLFKTKEERSLAEWDVCRLVYRLYGAEGKDVLTRLHNGRSGLVEMDEVRAEFRAQHGEERGFRWTTT